MIDTVIFDLDGTLLNTLDDLRDSVNFALSKFDFAPRTLDEVRNFVGNGVNKLFERAVPSGVGENIIEECVDIFKQHYFGNMLDKTASYKGIADMLKTLRASGYKIAIVSNKFDDAVKELSEKYFYNLIDMAIGQSYVIPPKPSPDGVLKVIRELDAHNAIYVGDSDVDIETAKNAGILCIAVSWGFRDRETLKGADFIADSTQELLEIIRSL